MARIVWRDTDKLIEEDDAGKQTTTWTNRRAPGAVIEAVSRLIATSSESETTINVLSPPAGLTPWVGDNLTDNTGPIRETFAWLSARAFAVGGWATLLIPAGSYRHKGIDLTDLEWPGLFPKLVIQGEPGLRGSMLYCTDRTAPNLAFRRAWNLIIRDIAFYQGLHGLYLDNCQYVRVDGCSFEQQEPVTGASFYAIYGQNIHLTGCGFLQSHSAVVEARGNTQVYLHGCLIGEMAEGCRVYGATLTIDDCKFLGVGIDHSPVHTALFEVMFSGRLTVSNTEMHLSPDPTALIHADSHGGIAVRDCDIFVGGEVTDPPLYLLSLNRSGHYAHPPVVMTGNVVRSRRHLVALTHPTDDTPENVLYTHNAVSVLEGAQYTPPPALVSSITDGNIVRVSPHPYH